MATNEEELIDILNKVKARFTDDSDLLWTSYETAKELRDELDVCIKQLVIGQKNIWNYLKGLTESTPKLKTTASIAFIQVWLACEHRTVEYISSEIPAERL